MRDVTRKIHSLDIWYNVQDKKLCRFCHVNELHSSFSQLDNSGSSAISVKGKGLTNVKMYVERKVFSKGKI